MKLQPLRHETRFLLPALVTSLVSVVPLLLHSGWPHNHEKLAFVFRTLVYSAHFSRGDLLPLWSSEDTFGLGSPMPLFYHKLFYSLSGLLHLVTGSMKLSLVTSIVIFLVVGCIGLHLASRRLGLSRMGSGLLAATLPLQSYTQFDWLVRGAMAELSACMVIPWLLHSLLVLIQDRRVAIGLPASLLALALAHSVLAYFGLVVVLLAVLIMALGTRAKRLPGVLVTLAAAAVVVLLALSPYLLAWQTVRESYDVSQISVGSFAPSRQFRDFLPSYLLPIHWRWGLDWTQVTVQMRPVTTIFFALAVVAGARELVGRRRRLDRSRLCGKDGVGGVVLLASSLAVFGFLQLRASGPVYDAVPGFAMIQFPWRLLAFIQALVLLVLAGHFARREAADGRVPITLLIFFALSVVGTKSFHPIRYEWFSAREIEARPEPGESPGAIGIGEYFPTAQLPEGVPAGLAYPSQRIGPLLYELSKRPPEFFAGGEGGSIRAVGARSFEQIDFEYAVECESAASVALPHFHSGLERVDLLRAKGVVSVPANRTDRDPRIRVNLPPGRHRVRVRLPRAGSALSLALRK